MRSFAPTPDASRRALFAFLLLSVVLFGGVALQRHGRARGVALRIPQAADFALPSSSAPPRVQVPLSVLPSGRVMVALAFGQSNSANYGATRRVAGERVYNFYRGSLYKAQDPMLGADGDGGSVWTRLGDKLVQRGLYDAVVFMSVGVGGTEIARWAPSGDLHRRVIGAIVDARSAGLSISHLLWHQGETDAGLKTTKEQYEARFEAMLRSIRGQGVNAPIYVSTATRCAYDDPDGSPRIRQAQAELVSPSRGILRGPDTDVLWDSYRRADECHFSDAGLDAAAELWLKALAPSFVAR